MVTLTLTPTLTLTLIEVVLSQQFYPRPQEGSWLVYQHLQDQHLLQEGSLPVQVAGFLLHPPLGASQVLEVLC